MTQPNPTPALPEFRYFADVHAMLTIKAPSDHEARQRLADEITRRQRPR